jgi:hypothetical protein
LQTGDRFGQLVVVRHVAKAIAIAEGHKTGYWLVQCDCGKQARAGSATALTKGVMTNCGWECGLRPRPAEAIKTGYRTAVKNLTGQRFGKLVAQRRMSGTEVGKKGSHWVCLCDCGNERTVRASTLVSGDRTSCGCVRVGPPPINITGQRYGILTAISLVDRPMNGQGAEWLCRCDCGKDHIARAKDLRYGNTASCGCLKNAKGHGLPGRKRRPALDINRPWRKDEQIDDRWLVLVGANVLPGTVV